MSWLAHLPDLHGQLQRLTFAKGASWGLRKRLYTDLLDMRNQLTAREIVADLRQSFLRVGRRADAETLRKVHQRLAAGQQLSQALGGMRALPPAELAMLAAGESKGNLDQALGQILASRKRVMSMVMTLYTSLASPLGYCAVLYAFAYGFGAHLAPLLTNTLASSPRSGGAPGEMSGAGHVLFLVGRLATGYGAPMIVGLIAIGVVCLARALPRWTGRVRFFLDGYVFPFTLYRAFHSAIWLLHFTMMRDAGVPAATALAEQILHASPWLRSYLKPLHRQVEGGVPLAVALRRSGRGFPSGALIERIGRLESTNAFSERMKELADEHANRVELKVKLASAALGALMFMACMALVLLAQAGLDGIFGGAMKHYH
ncbi:type II secretion system F family protein [Burkholderia glumae]|uniref:type II secretion system F family protein n=1 Tax=Burkholderia glumae TaxID=337 RepID=UPI002149A19E|nr:type II secretion system F family protein [Burkholderia glumae]MCR1769764.1 type II secretion system F family protein [Burkholderia glumae]